MDTAQAKTALLIDCANALEIKEAEISEIKETLNNVLEYLEEGHDELYKQARNVLKKYEK